MSVVAESKLIIRALNGELTERPPFWLMRQAGRYLPEYRALREEAKGFLNLCYNPALATEVTLQPIRRFGMDAAILFSDILVVPDALGVGVAFQEGEGPVLTPVRTDQQLAQLSLSRLHDHLSPVYAAISAIRRELPLRTALIGFAGAPWTLAAYVVEGGGSKEFQVARTLARREPALFSRLVDLLTEAVIEFLDQQVRAGAELLQIFDSWAGVLPPDQLELWSVAPMRTIVAELKNRHPAVPIIYFPRGAGTNIGHIHAQVGADGLSLDTGTSLELVSAWFPRQVCLQGNLDPIDLLVGGEPMLERARGLIAAAQGRPWIFNLGHGVLPQTDPEQVAALAALIKGSLALKSSR